MNENIEHRVASVNSASEFDSVVSSEVPTLVDFWAEWCPPCRVLGPMLERLAPEVAPHATLVKVDVDAVPDLAARFQIRGIPTMVILKSGREVDRMVGLVPVEEITRRLLAA